MVREHFCDGLGDCLPECPTGAISFEEREAPEYTEEAVKEAQKKALQNWPVQIKLAPVNAPYFNGAKLLIAADCTAYAYASFHQDFIRNKVTLIGCPKLDQVDYSEKLTAIFQNNSIQSVTIVRMEVPCCGGLELGGYKKKQIRTGINGGTKVTTGFGHAENSVSTISILEKSVACRD